MKRHPSNKQQSCTSPSTTSSHALRFGWLEDWSLQLPCGPKGTMTHLPAMCESLWGLVFLVVIQRFLDKEHQDHPIQGAYRLYQSLHHQPQVPSAWLSSHQWKLRTWTLRGPWWILKLDSEHMYTDCYWLHLESFWHLDFIDLTMWYWRSAEKLAVGLNLLRTCRSFTRRSSRIKRSNRKSIRFPDDSSLVRFNSTALSGACVRQRRGGKGNWETELWLCAIERESSLCPCRITIAYGVTRLPEIYRMVFAFKALWKAKSRHRTPWSLHSAFARHIIYLFQVVPNLICLRLLLSFRSWLWLPPSINQYIYIYI